MSAEPRTAPDVDVSVIIVNYNVREFLEQALHSIRRATGDLRVEIFVVDNSSVDGSVEMVREQFPEVHLIENRENVGFGRANNQAMRQARGEYLFLLNPDTLVAEDTLRVLKAFMDAHPEAGAAGCKILNPDGSFAYESRRAFPTPAVAFYRLSGLSRLFPKSPVFGRYNMTYLPEDVVAEVDALSGSCMFIRRAALVFSRATVERLEAEGRDVRAEALARDIEDGDGAGLFDEAFFMYGEDIDLCYAIKSAGWRIYYMPDTQIIHYKGESTRRGELRYVRHFYGAMITFARKHFEHRFSRLFIWLLQGGIFLRGALTALGNLARRLLAPALDALLAALAMMLAMQWRAAQTGVHPPPDVEWLLPLLFGAGVAGGTALFGGYRSLRPSRALVLGTLGSVLMLAVLAFFVKALGYSRLVLLLAAIGAVLLLTGWRLLYRWLRRRPTGPPRALVVGDPASVSRLAHRLHQFLIPPFDLVGYVPPDESTVNGASVPRLGGSHQLRDIVRLRAIDEVIFDARSVSNEFIIEAIQQLHHLPVHCKILSQGQEHLIARADVQSLMLPLVDVDDVLPGLRHGGGYRWGMRLVALGGFLSLPLAFVLQPVVPRAFREVLREWIRRVRRMSGVWKGTHDLVGYDPQAPVLPPERWGLFPGIFTLDELPRALSPESETVMKTYAYYAGHRSLRLDMAIILRILQHRYRLYRISARA